MSPTNLNFEVSLYFREYRFMSFSKRNRIVRLSKLFLGEAEKEERKETSQRGRIRESPNASFLCPSVLGEKSRSYVVTRQLHHGSRSRTSVTRVSRIA